MPNLKGYKRTGEPTAAVKYEPMDLLRFIPKNWVPLNLMMERAGISEMDNYTVHLPNHTKDRRRQNIRTADLETARLFRDRILQGKTEALAA